MFFYAGLIVAKGFFVKQVAFLRLAGGVADHTGGATEKYDGAVAAFLQVLEHHHAHEMSDVEGVGGRINADVSRGHLFLELFFRSGHHIVNHATPFQFFNKVHFITCLIHNF